MLEKKLSDLQWRVLSHTISSAPWQMAVDHALLEVMNKNLAQGKKIEPLVRTFQFDKSAVVLGYQQDMSKLDKAALNGHSLTTRVSGGGHMYFSPDDIHYSVIFPKSWNEGDLIAVYRMINQPVAEALKSLGYNARVGRTSIKIDTSEEKTLVGTAQYGKSHVMLQHGSILIHDYTDEIFNLLKASEAERQVWKEKIITLAMLGEVVNPDKIAQTLIGNFVTRDYAFSSLSSEEEAQAKDFYTQIYNNSSVIESGQKKVEHLCLLEGLMTQNYNEHLRQNSGVNNDKTKPR